MQSPIRLRRLAVLLLTLVLTLPVEANAAAYVPQIIAAMGRQLDRQVVDRLNQPESPATGVSLFMTTPVDVNDLETSNPLARQIQEELATWFVQAGYKVQEIRKGTDLLFDPVTGEMLLTRRSNLVGQEMVNSGAIVVGTYTITPQHVRFNIRLVLSGSQEVIAMSSMSIPVEGEIAALLSADGSGRSGGGMPIAPTVDTMLP